MRTTITTRRVLAAAGTLLVLTGATACGGSKGLSADAVAKCNGKDITRSDLDTLMARAQNSYTAQKQTFPKAGSAAYVQLQQQAVAQLVQQCEIHAGTGDLGLSVSDSDVSSRLAQIQKQYFPTKDGKGVDQKKYEAALKQQGYSESTFKDQIREQLLEQKAYDQVTKNVTVSAAGIQKYYDQNKKTLYTTGPSRHVRHILVKSKALAATLYSQLRLSPGKFAALAKKYSKDPGSAVKGGDLGDMTQGQTVPQFNTIAFQIPTNIISRPVKTQFGYHIIEALGPVKQAAVKPLDATLKAQIKAQLEQTSKQKAFYAWFQKEQAKIAPKVQYAKGYAPPSTSTTSTT